jgi:hypothetical protein
VVVRTPAGNPNPWSNRWRRVSRWELRLTLRAPAFLWMARPPQSIAFIIGSGKLDKTVSCLGKGSVEPPSAEG